MQKRNFAFGKDNFILIVVAVAIIIVGFVLMSGGRSADGVSYNPDIFGAQRITIAPIVTMIGFGLMVFGILKNSKEKQTKE
ncbi:MAG: DUF3098 domain-containing protein [Tannerellaceae bacterium]|jgi:uncharacterized membrane protein|nr:DUF3098 domain-containing protein [Tannerellaceae bacterium]